MERETGTFTQERERVEAVRREEEKAIYGMAGGSMLEALLGASAVVLSILGLLNIMPAFMASVAVIALGASILFGGGALVARFSRAMSTAERSTAAEMVQGGVAFQALAGTAAIVLGVLALLAEAANVTLLSVALIVLGGATLLSSNLIASVNMVLMRMRERSEAVMTTSGIDILVGLAAIVLGILALAGYQSGTMILAGTLSIGAAVVLSGSALASRAVSMFVR